MSSEAKQAAEALAAERKKMPKNTYLHRCHTCGYETTSFAAAQRHVDAEHSGARIENNHLNPKEKH